MMDTKIEIATWKSGL